jgi:mycothiol synthase
MSHRVDPSPVLVAERDGARGIATPSRDGWEIDLTAGSGRLDVPIATTLLRELVAQIPPATGTSRWRVPTPSAEHHRIAAAAGFDAQRTLWQMRRPLPADPPEPSLALRSFVPGADDDEWLRVNNAAFDWHPEQGGWGHAELDARLSEPWVELDGFLLHPAGRPGDRIDGFCWTKIDRTVTPQAGEIFVIAVDPSSSGSGLGRRLVLAGLDWLHEHGCETALLYTESDNAPAVGLYESLGFVVHHEVRVFTRVGDDAAQTPTPTSDPIP